MSLTSLQSPRLHAHARRLFPVVYIRYLPIAAAMYTLNRRRSVFLRARVGARRLPYVAVFVRAARPTHDHRHVGVVRDVRANASEDCAPEFAESASADHDHVGIALSRHLDHSLSRLAIADDVPTGDLQYESTTSVGCSEENSFRFDKYIKVCYIAQC